MELYILDEPEAALSPQRQMTLLCYIYDLAKNGSQFIIATHSPILLSYKYGKIIDMNNNMEEIIQWLSTFTVGEKVDALTPTPGTNHNFVEIKYINGSVVKAGLDVIKIDGTSYSIEKDKTPDCFWDIISNSHLP